MVRGYLLSVILLLVVLALFVVLVLLLLLVVVLVVVVATAAAHVLGLGGHDADVALDVNRDAASFVVVVHRRRAEAEHVGKLELLALGLAVDVAVLVVDQHLLGLVDAMPDLVEVLRGVQFDLAATDQQGARHVYALHFGLVMFGGGACCQKLPLLAALMRLVPASVAMQWPLEPALIRPFFLSLPVTRTASMWVLGRSLQIVSTIASS